MTAVDHDHTVERWCRCIVCHGFEPVHVHPEATQTALVCSGCGDAWSTGRIVAAPTCAYCPARAVTSDHGEPRCFAHHVSAGARAEVDHAAE